MTQDQEFQKAIQIANQFVESKGLAPHEFDVSMTCVRKSTKARTINSGDLQALSNIHSEALVNLSWKRAGTHAADQYSRDLLIDLTNGVVTKEIWPQ